MKLKLFLTFDHELPLGEITASYADALFKPTDFLIEIARNNHVPITLFTDILCAKRFKEWNFDEFYLPYLKQIEKALLYNNDVQLHIHPHWLTSEFENGKVKPSKDFALSDFKNNKRFDGIDGIIKMSVDELNQYGKKISDKYQCVAFRAGGYNIFPFTEEIFNSLYRYGIKFDSTIAKGYFFKSDLSEVDFTKTPRNANWIINSQRISDEFNGAGILEIPIATKPKSIFEIPTRFKINRLEYRAPIPNGKIIHTTSNVDIFSKLKMMYSARMLTFDNYTFSSDYLMKILEYNVKKYSFSDKIMLSVISHPKSMGEYSFTLMEEFIQKVRKRYTYVEFCTYSTIK